MATKTPPFKLWQQAEGDTGRYLELLREHGHIIPRESEASLPDNERLIAATRRERAEAEARDLKNQFDSHARARARARRAACAPSTVTTARGRAV